MQGKFSKIRGIFESRRPVTTEEEQGPGRWERVRDRSGVRYANQLTINSRKTGLLRIDQGYINWGVLVQGNFSRIRVRFESRIPGTRSVGESDR